ncbi:hypothetical protein MLD38_015109 [Melastoma candidum]|uniref:Uncharacterized protein n=1 Tax=Melastoma candidum TaxID=119954 RepID=A0ACB9RFM4_9MYRT|nr:hypothetical protein MLD38_015109 [Melastoma candidum]
MVFQDFDHLSERRRAERRQKAKKRIVIAAISSLAIAGVIAGTIIGIDHRNAAAASPEHPHDTNQVSHPQKAIEMICQSTDYKDTCKSTLVKAVKKDPSMSQPKDLLKLAVQSTQDEVQAAFDKAKSLKFDSPREKAAFKDCKVLIDDALTELRSSVAGVSDIKKLSQRTPDLNNWLSAVMSYRETCIDGFPEGKSKGDMNKTLQVAKELTSNSLAIIGEVSSFLSSLHDPGAARHLLEEPADDEGLPAWINNEERRILKGKPKAKPKPNVIIAKDGSGNFTTINAALAAMPKEYTGKYIIYIKAGTYNETVVVTTNMINVLMYGDGSQKTIITGNKNYVDGVSTYLTASFAALGEGFMAQAMGFRNTAGPDKHQAVAIRVQADRAILLNCRFEGYQDTLYAQTHRQFYRSCVIAGTVDFIFGDAAAIFQNCLIIVRKPLDNQQNIVTAQGRTDRHETTGIVIQNSRIVSDKELVPVKNVIPSYLGRPWKEFSRTIIMECSIDNFIHPDGFLPWMGDFALDTLYYAEYDNKGPGAKLDGRVHWAGYKRKFTRQDAMKFTVGPFLEQNDTWVQQSGVPVHYGLFQ